MFSRIAVGLACLLALALGAVLCAQPAVAQMQLGTVSTPVSLTACPALQMGSFDPTMACWSANVSCPNTDQIGVVYGVSTPTGQLKGTIVMLSGDGGVNLPGTFEDYIEPTTIGQTTYQGYLGLGYQVVEAVWGVSSGNPPTLTPEDWEYTDTLSGSNAPNILNAACRPATFLNWVRNGNPQSGVGKGIWAGNQGQTGTFGMCAHVNSGGAGATGYSLAWYNAGAGGAAAWGSGYLDKVVMENGPVFSDIEQGCEVTAGQNTNATYICSGNSQLGVTEPGCNFNWSGYQSPTDYKLEYVDGDQSYVAGWTQNVTSQSDPECGSRPGTTSPGQDSLWYSMSIVNTALSQQPSFRYPNTAMSGWLCQNVLNPPPNGPPENNSAPEGQLFFAQFTSASDTAILSVNGVANCMSNENVESGSLTYAGTSYGGSGQLPAYEAIIKDMTTNIPQVTLSCATMGQTRAQQ